MVQFQVKLFQLINARIWSLKMELFSGPLLAVVLLIQTISVNGENGKQSLVNSNDKFGEWKSKSYSLTSDILNDAEECRQRVEVSGNGISDIFYVPCEYDDHFTIQSDDLLLYHNKMNSFYLLSVRPSELVVVDGSDCTKREYSTVGGKITSTSLPMNGDDCDKARERIDHEEEERGVVGGVVKSYLSMKNTLLTVVSPFAESIDAVSNLVFSKTTSESAVLPDPVHITDSNSGSDITFQVFSKGDEKKV